MNRKSALDILVVGCSGVGKVSRSDTEINIQHKHTLLSHYLQTSYINQLTNSGPYPPPKDGKGYKITPFILETARHSESPTQHFIR